MDETVKKTRKTYVKINKLGGFTFIVEKQTWLLYSLTEQAETRNKNPRLTNPNNVVWLNQSNNHPLTIGSYWLSGNKPKQPNI